MLVLFASAPLRPAADRDGGISRLGRYFGCHRFPSFTCFLAEPVVAVGYSRFGLLC